MRQRDAPGMKSLTRQPRIGLSIERVAQDRQADCGQVHPDLMCAPGHELALNDRVALTTWHNLVTCLAVCAVRRHDHTSSIDRVTCQRQHDPSLSKLG